MAKSNLDNRVLVDLTASLLERGGSLFIQKSGSVVVELHISPEIARAAVNKAVASKLSVVLLRRMDA